MRLHSFYSSSKANLYAVEAANGQRLLIECGVTPKQLLKALGYKLDNVVGCLVTHEHQDHAKSIEYLMDNGIDVYASYGTFDSLGIDPVDVRKANVITDKHGFFIDDFHVFSFEVEHDAIEPLGFVISVDSEHLLFVTDTFMVKQRFGLAFNIIAICCNYDKEILQARVDSGDINETYAKRLLVSHMEKQTTKKYIKNCCCLDKCVEIHLLHMSGLNADKEAIRLEFEKEFMVKTYVG